MCQSSPDLSATTQYPESLARADALEREITDQGAMDFDLAVSGLMDKSARGAPCKST